MQLYLVLTQKQQKLDFTNQLKTDKTVEKYINFLSIIKEKACVNTKKFKKIHKVNQIIIFFLL